MAFESNAKTACSGLLDRMLLKAVIQSTQPRTWPKIKKRERERDGRNFLCLERIKLIIKKQNKKYDTYAR